MDRHVPGKTSRVAITLTRRVVKTAAAAANAAGIGATLPASTPPTAVRAVKVTAIVAAMAVPRARTGAANATARAAAAGTVGKAKAVACWVAASFPW